MNKTKISMQIRRILKLFAPPAALPAATLLTHHGFSSLVSDQAGAPAAEPHLKTLAPLSVTPILPTIHPERSSGAPF
jgi:hypothetical protein